MLLLKILALEPMNGFAVSQRLKQMSSDVLQVSDGSLYPALHKLEQEGWITAEWKTSEYGRRAKYYSLTRLGRRQLEKEADNWGRLSSAISRVIKLKRRDVARRETEVGDATGALAVHDSATAAVVVSPGAGGPGIGRRVARGAKSKLDSGLRSILAERAHVEHGLRGRAWAFGTPVWARLLLPT
jgi:PadR family transcriptional regulator PadR